MGHYQAFGKLDSQIAEDGDVYFNRLDMRRDKGILTPGTVVRSENKRMWTGRLETRSGFAMAPNFNPPFESLIVGTGLYQNTVSGGEVLLIATQNSDYVWACQDGKDPIKISIGDPVNATVGPGPVEFTQSFSSIRMHRRPTNTYVPLEWDGNPSHDFNTAPPSQISGTLTIGQSYVITDYHASDDFSNVGASSNATGVVFTATGTTPTTWSNGSLLTFSPPPGSKTVPPTWTGEPFENRLLFYNASDPFAAEFVGVPGRDQFIMSDVLDSTTYDPVFGAFDIGVAQSDIIVRIWPYFHQGVIIFMRRSIWMQVNFTVDPLLTQQQLLNSSIGAIATKGVLLVGGDALFLSEPGGIYRLSEVVQQSITTEPVPVSEPIDPIIKRINWRNAFLSYVVATAVLGDYAYFAVPLDEVVGGSNVLLVFNTVTKQWESVDTWPDSDFRINSMHVLQVGDKQSLLACDFFGRRIILMESGAQNDEVGVDEFPIQDVVETRGYNLGNPFGFKRYQRMTMMLRSFDPSFKVTAIRDGYNDEIPLANGDVITKDRTKFYRAEHKDFNPLTDDPNEPLREDYSFSNNNDYIVDDFSDIPAGPINTLPARFGDVTGPKQESLERFAIGTTARALSLRIENSQGSCDLLSVSVEGRAIDNRTAVVA